MPERPKAPPSSGTTTGAEAQSLGILTGRASPLFHITSDNTTIAAFVLPDAALTPLHTLLPSAIC
jgi:hypothetical protein